MFNDSCFSNEVTDFRKLRTGHKRLKVVVVDQDHHILFIARVFQNRPRTTGKLRFDNKKSFDLRSRTVGSQKVSLFFWTEDLEYRWLWQSEIEKILRWLEAARPEDVIALADIVSQESGRPQVQHHPILTVCARQQLSKHLHELGLVQLQRIAETLYAVLERTAA